MYSFIHRYKSFTLAVIALATGGFFLWLFFAGGVEDMTTPSKRCVVEVGSGCVTLRDYRRELLRFSQLLNSQQMEDLVREQVLSNLTAQELLYQQAMSLSLIASDEEVVEVIKSDPTFQENGLFSVNKYREAVARAGMTPEEYEEYLKKTIAVQKLIALLTNGVYLTDKELELNLLVETTLLKGSLYVVSPSQVKDQYSPTTQELVDYYQKNRETFKKQEGKRLWVWREKDKERALSLYRELKAGREPQAPQELRLSEDLPKLEGALSAEAQRLTPQDRVSITKQGEEYVVLYLKEVLPAGYEDFETVKEKVKERLLEEKAGDMALKKAQEVARALKEGKRPDLKPLNFSDTPMSQLRVLVDIDQKDLVRIALSQDRVFGPYPLRQGYGVLLVEKRDKKELSEEEKEETTKDLLSLKAQAVLSQYIEHLKRKNKVRVNRELLGGG
ncbi:MAG: SurA N-terminal domain-containing protein [Aquificaceae bacterium]|nr:SurA N-terminal domain-containing protein [Aquificaceae bacterium]MDW8097059.1 SurA N-terminal domain-containing protein [Aquificaceae bacterium]